MTENICNSLESLPPIVTAKFSHTQSPGHFEAYRNELHHELVTHWPFHTDISDPTNTASTISKSTAHSNHSDYNKLNVTNGDNNSVYQAPPYLQSNNVALVNATGLNEKKGEINISTDSEFSLNRKQQRMEWNLKAQEGIITYQLPDSLPDGIALYNKLHKLMKTNTIYLNDRHFWSTMENRFKSLRKQNFHQNMERLRQNQQQYEQELISKGIIPYTTEEAIKNYAQQRSLQTITNKTEKDNLHHTQCLIDYLPSNKKFEDNVLNTSTDFEAFESDNIHPGLHEIFTDYKFQTKSGKDLGEKFENDLYKSQIQMKTIFPKTNPRDRLRQELEAIKTSEGLYTYSNRLSKQILK